MKKYIRATKEDCASRGFRYPNPEDHDRVLVRLPDERTLFQKIMLKEKRTGLIWISKEELNK